MSYWNRKVRVELGNQLRPVIIIGAARSGTNILRDLLTSFIGVATWPCDEIPFVWRYGNARILHDEFTPQMASPTTRRYIRNVFERLGQSTKANVIVEKTCANTLRVGFVDAVIPEAHFVYLVRNGVDTILSAMKRWVAPPDLNYLFRKAQFVPLRELPLHGWRFLNNQFKQLRSEERRLATWGPRFAGMADLAARASLVEVCAHQWVRCVNSAEESLATIDDSRVSRVTYETLVDDPIGTLRSLTNQLSIHADNSSLKRAALKVRQGGGGERRNRLSEIDRQCLLDIAGQTLRRCGYPVD